MMSKDISKLIVLEVIVALQNIIVGYGAYHICNQLGNWDAFYNLYLTWAIITTIFPPIYIFYLKKLIKHCK